MGPQDDKGFPGRMTLSADAAFDDAISDKINISDHSVKPIRAWRARMSVKNRAGTGGRRPALRVKERFSRRARAGTLRQTSSPACEGSS